MGQLPPEFEQCEAAQDASCYINWLRERGSYLQDLHDRFNGIITDKSRNLREYDGDPEKGDFIEKCRLFCLDALVEKEVAGYVHSIHKKITSKHNLFSTVLLLAFFCVLKKCVVSIHQRGKRLNVR